MFGSLSSTILSKDFIDFTDIISIKYVDNNHTTKSGIITVELEYSPSTLVTKYRNITYSDPLMEKHVENNPSVLRNIDSYDRNKMLISQYHL
jgi:hypothetical protein